MADGNTSDLSPETLGYIYLPVEAEIVKWKVGTGSIVYDGRILVMYKEKDKNAIHKLKCTKVGKIRKFLVSEGDIVKPECPLLELELGCSHPTVINELCAECGADLQAEEKNKQRALFSMVHSIPQLKVNEEQAQILGKADEARLLKDRKLVLLVDLDQTLIHTTNDNIPNNFKDVHHFQLYGPRSPWYHTRLRPNTNEFLSRISNMYELHICTFGSRNYAHMIAHILDPDGKYFSHRILSRDECFDPYSKTANLKALFPCGEDLVCIIDDREDVWEYGPNLIHVKPYHFFQHTGDIHAPPELTKCENDKLLNSNFVHLAQGITAKQKIKLQEDSDKQKNETSVSSGGGDIVSSEPIFKRYPTKKKSEPPKKEEQNERCDSAGKDQISSSTANTISNISSLVDVTINNTTDSRSKNVVDGKNSEFSKVEIKNLENAADRSVVDIIDRDKQNLVTDDDEKRNSDDALRHQTSNAQSENEAIDDDNNKKEDPNETLNNTEDDNNEPTSKDSVSVSNTETSGNDETQYEKSTDDDSDEMKKAIAKVAVLAEMLNDVDARKSDSLVERSDENVAATVVGGGGEEGAAYDNNATTSLSGPEITGGNVEIGGHLVKVEWNSTPLVEELIELEEQDDYLLHLEQILTNIHEKFFVEYDRCERMPNLKTIIPIMRSNILTGVNLVFSGVVPGHVKLQDSRAYKVAISIGAKVSQNIEPDTTHLVAVRMGTAKVHTAQRRKNIKIVTPEWLWLSAERWTKVDENLYPMKKTRLSSRHPPAHCSSPERTPPSSPPLTHRSGSSNSNAGAGAAANAAQSSDKFIDTIHPLMRFSSEDIAKMSDEVEDICNESESDSDDKRKKEVTVLSSSSKSSLAGKKHVYKREDNDETSSSCSEDSCGGPSYKKTKYFRKFEDRCAASRRRRNYDNETVNEKFRRGEALPSDLDLGISEDESDDAAGVQSDNECDIMAAAIEEAFRDDYQ